MQLTTCRTRKLLLLTLVLLIGASGQTPPNVLTYHNDVARTGQNTLETQLTPSNVNTPTFGRLFSIPVDSWALAQPLYLAGLSIGDATYNVVYVTTLNNSVYAFDADDGSILWQAQYETPT